VSGSNDEIVVATNAGIFKTRVNNPQFSNYNTWSQITSQNFDHVVHNGNNIYATQNNNIFLVVDDTVTLVKSISMPIQSIGFSSDNNLLITSQDTGTYPFYILKLSPQGNIIDSISGTFG